MDNEKRLSDVQIGYNSKYANEEGFVFLSQKYPSFNWGYFEVGEHIIKRSNLYYSHLPEKEKGYGVYGKRWFTVLAIINDSCREIRNKQEKSVYYPQGIVLCEFFSQKEIVLAFEDFINYLEEEKFIRCEAKKGEKFAEWAIENL